MSYTMGPSEVSADLDAEAADRRRQLQPPRGPDHHPALELVNATPEQLEALGWTAEETERLHIEQMLVPACELCARHAAGDPTVGKAHGGIHDVVYGNGMFSCRRPCLGKEGARGG